MKYDSLQDFVTAVRETRGWSIRRLAEELGYSSPTSILRVLQGKANAESLDKFGKALGAMTSEPLTDEEIVELKLLLERGLSDDDSYRSTHLFISIMRNEVPEQEPVLLEDAATGRITTLRERYGSREGLRITIMNCEQVPMYRELAKMEAERPFPLDHFFLVDGPASLTVERMLAILPMIYNPHYQIFSRDAGGFQPQGLLQADMMLCAWRENGTEQFDVVTFQQRGHGLYANHHSAVENVLPLLTRAHHDEGFRPVRVINENEGIDFVDYCRYCTDLERDRTVMRIKPDVGVEQIPVEILADAYRDGCGSLPEAQAILPVLIDLFTERRLNAENKRQPSYHVMMRWGMWRFARTGRLSDHPWMLRSFTVEERKHILLTLMERMKHNRSFHLYFAQDDDVHREDEFVYYEGVGLCLVKPHTNYQLGSDHAEIMISQKSFCEAYSNFYLNHVIRYRTMPPERTLTLLQEMLRYLADHPDA